jgi:hypothetical protein
MAVTITRTPWIDDDGTGTTGTVINNAVKTGLYNEIDAALAKLAPINADGSLPSNGQIVFPAVQNPSAGANTLDDYEEGSWTPIVGGGGGTSGQTYTAQVGTYVKVGQLVVASYQLQLSAKGTITGNVQIQGLPFPVSAAALNNISSLYFYSLATSWISVNVITLGSTSAAALQGLAVAGTANNVSLAAADIANNSLLSGTIIYRAAQ